MRANAGTSRKGRSFSFIFCCIILFLSPGCREQPPAPEDAGGRAVSPATASIDQRSYRLGGIGAFAEMVGAGVKKLALSAAMPAAEMDARVVQAREMGRLLSYPEERIASMLTRRQGESR